MLVHAEPGRAILKVVLGTLVFCGCAYRADSFSYGDERFRGVYVTIDCLDLAIERRKDRANGSNVVAYAFGNRCDEPTIVDLASARVYGRTADGAAIQLFAFDPDHELRSLRVDGRAVGREAIEYSGEQAIQSVCIDAASIAHTGPPRWLCFYE